MIMRITIGDHVSVLVDDDMNDTRLTPEQVEDYLTRMRRTALDAWDHVPDAVTAEDEQS